MNRLMEAKKRVSDIMDGGIAISGFGADVTEKENSDRWLRITVNDWTGNEKSRLCTQHLFKSDYMLLLLLHELIEDLNIEAS